MSYRPPGKAPSDRSHLERLVQALSVEEGIAADRLRRWVSAQVLLGALSRDGDDRRRFLLKGGVAMELRLRLRARATKDIDIVVFAETGDDLIDTLQAALEHHLDGLADRGGEQIGVALRRPDGDARVRAASPLRSSSSSAEGSGSPLRCQRAIRATSSSSRGSKPGSPVLSIR